MGAPLAPRLALLLPQAQHHPQAQCHRIVLVAAWSIASICAHLTCLPLALSHASNAAPRLRSSCEEVLCTPHTPVRQLDKRVHFVFVDRGSRPTVAHIFLTRKLARKVFFVRPSFDTFPFSAGVGFKTLASLPPCFQQ